MRQKAKARETRRAKLLRIPESTLRKIETAAKAERRTVQGQILYYIDLALSDDGKAA